MAKNPYQDSRAPYTVSAALFSEIIGVVNSLFELSESQIRGGVTPERTLKSQKAMSRELLVTLRAMRDENEKADLKKLAAAE